MPFTQDDLDNGLHHSLSVARQRRAQLLQGPQESLIKPDRMKAALKRRQAKGPDFGDLPLPNTPLNGGQPT